MDRRNFFTVAAGAVLANSLRNSSSAQPSEPLEFAMQSAGAAPFRRTLSGDRPHILLISADMISPDLYHPTRPLSQHIHIPNIRITDAGWYVFLERLLYGPTLLAFACLLHDRPL